MLGSGNAQNQNYMLKLSHDDGGAHSAEAAGRLVGQPNQDGNRPGNVASDEIEESIIEEDIDLGTGQVVQSPVSPLINSRTKGKGKLDLFMMRPPRAEGNNRQSPNDLAAGPTLHAPPGQGAHRAPPFIFNRGAGYGHLQLVPQASGTQAWNKYGDPSVIDEETSGSRQRARNDDDRGPRRGTEEPDEVHDPSILLGRTGDASCAHGEQAQDDYDAMYDILVEPEPVQGANTKGSAYYQRNASQDRLDLMDNQLEDRTEVPSINGGLPITMQVKKEPSFVQGGAFAGTGYNLGQALSAGTSSTALSQLKQRRPFSPPLKQNFQDKDHTREASLDKGGKVHETKMDQDGVPPNTVVEEIV